MLTLSQHKARIKSQIRVEAYKRETRTSKPEVKRKHYHRKRYRFDTYHVGESCG